MILIRTWRRSNTSDWLSSIRLSLIFSNTTTEGKMRMYATHLHSTPTTWSEWHQQLAVTMAMEISQEIVSRTIGGWEPSKHLDGNRCFLLLGWKYTSIRTQVYLGFNPTLLVHSNIQCIELKKHLFTNRLTIVEFLINNTILTASF